MAVDVVLVVPHGISWDVRRSDQSIRKELNPEYSLERLMLKLQYFDYLMWRADSLQKTLMLGKIEGKRRRGWQRIRWLDSITNAIDLNLSKFWEIVKDRGAWSDGVQGVAKRLSNWMTTTNTKEFDACLFIQCVQTHTKSPRCARYGDHNYQDRLSLKKLYSKRGKIGRSTL